jgi:hypothetical protein
VSHLYKSKFKNPLLLQSRSREMPPKMEANCPTIKGDLLKLVRQLEDASCIQIIPTTNFHTFCPAGLVNSQQLKGQTIWLGGPPINARKK